MQAVISGQAGVALLLDGEKLSSIRAGSTEEVVRRRDREIPYLFGDAKDHQFFEDIELLEVARELESATTRAEALHIALILLDPQLTHDIRRDAAEELSELFETEGVLEHVEAVLYSHPVPGDGDLPGALLCCPGRSGPARQFLLRLKSLQGEIATVYEAWERISDRVFGSEQRRRHALATAIREGCFRDLVLARAKGWEIDEDLLETRPPFRGEGRVILRTWLSSFQADHETDLPYEEARAVHWVAERDEHPEPAAAEQDPRYGRISLATLRKKKKKPKK